MQRSHRRGCTLVECAALLCVAGGGLACLRVLQPEDGPDPLEKAAWEAKDQSQLHDIVRSMTIMRGAIGEVKYPLPSLVDTGDAAVAEQGSAKDTTANIFSVLIFVGSVSPEMTISAAEVNPSIKRDDDYTFDRPPTAVKPERAMWDPAFSADFTGGKVGNVSYATLQASSGRTGLYEGGRERGSLEPIVANRGPEIAAITAGEDGRPDVRLARKDSNTLRIHGAPDSWEGIVAYNDGHAARVDSLRPMGGKTADGKPAWISYRDEADAERLDVYFYDERDNPARDNIFLGMFTRAGAAPGDWHAIWD